jgi:hypothetical protein
MLAASSTIHVLLCRSVRFRFTSRAGRFVLETALGEGRGQQIEFYAHGHKVQKATEVSHPPLPALPLDQGRERGLEPAVVGVVAAELAGPHKLSDEPFDRRAGNPYCAAMQSALLPRAALTLAPAVVGTAPRERLASPASGWSEHAAYSILSGVRNRSEPIRVLNFLTYRVSALIILGAIRREQKKEWRSAVLSEESVGASSTLECHETGPEQGYRPWRAPNPLKSPLSMCAAACLSLGTHWSSVSFARSQLRTKD